MRVRDVYLAKADTLSDTQSKTYIVPPGLKIQHVRVRYAATNGATSNTVGKLNGMVSKLEFVDGSDIWHSVSMQEEQALNFYNGNIFSNNLPKKILSAGAAVVVAEDAIMTFGRFIGDREYYLDTSRLKNPLIRLTHALTISATAGFATGTGAVSVILRVIDDGAPPYKGCVMAKELKSVSTAASGDDQLILPLDWPYMSLMVGALKTTILPDAVLTNIKLWADAGRIVFLDMTATDLLGENIDRYGWAEESFNPLSDTASTFLSDLYYRTNAWAGIGGATGKLLVSSVTAESIVMAMTTGQAADTMTCKIVGASPFASFFIPFGNAQDAVDFLDPKPYGELKLFNTQGTSAATLTVVSQQIRV